jgi:hypothetical protein
VRRLAFVLLLAACSTASNATTNDAGSPDVRDASDPVVDAALDASDASALSEASADANDASDASDGFTYVQFPESSYPNGWLVASQGTSPNN